jgi:hypothetical protein
LKSTTSSALGLVGALCAGFLGGRVGSSPQDPSKQQAAPIQSEVRARRLLLVNERDEICGGFGVGEGSQSSFVTLWMRTRGDGGPSVLLGIDELEGTPEARLMLTSEDGAAHVPGKLSLRSGSGIPTVALIHGDGETRQFIVLGSESSEAGPALSRELAGVKTSWP